MDTCTSRLLNSYIAQSPLFKRHYVLFCFVLLGLQPWHVEVPMEVPGQGIKSELQLQPML